MFAGHFGIAAAVKSKNPDLPLWSLLVSTQLLDIAFIPLNLAGIEKMESIGEGGFGDTLIYAFYSHSLVGAIVLSLLAAVLAGRFWGKQSGLIIGFVAFSHWILDLIVHHPDMPILPGNAGNFPLLGFGLWNYYFASMLVEFLLIAAGSFLYFRYALRKATPKTKGKAIFAGSAMTVFLLLAFGSNFI